MSIASNRLPEFLLIKNVQRWIDIRKIDAIFANIFGLSINTKFIHIHLINRSFVATPDNRTNIRRGIQFIWCEANNQVPTFIILWNLWVLIWSAWCFIDVISVDRCVLVIHLEWKKGTESADKKVISSQCDKHKSNILVAVEWERWCHSFGIFCDF